MSYPGNPSLPAAVKDRVMSTFEQTLILFRQGRLDEVQAGCNLILQMDSSFGPARQLLEKSRNPELPIDIDHLLPADELPALKRARDAMAAGEYARAIDLTSEILSADLFNEEARVLAEEARHKLEAGATSPAPSFVVDEQPSASVGRAAAPASSFGFSFEEEPASMSFDSFSFDAPPTGKTLSGIAFEVPTDEPGAVSKNTYGGTASRMPTGEFDFATASVEMTADDQQKINQYLADGERAFAAGDYHQAIDLWSRVFLIDVTNDEASQRIEEAKNKRREIDQKIEPLLASGMEAFERGDMAAARNDLTEVLQIDPGNAMAQSYLDRLSQAPAPGAPEPAAPAVPKTTQSTPYDDLFDSVPAAPPPSVAPAPVRRPAAPRPPAPAKATPSRNVPVAALIAVAAVVLLGAALWFLLPRFGGGGQGDPVESEGLIARASILANAGKFDQAIALLQEIKPNDPLHDKALVMISDLQQKKAASAQTVDGVPAAQFYDERLAAGREAFAQHDYSRAKAAFEQAMRVKPLPADAKEQYDFTTQQTAKLTAATTLFAERKYDEAIANLHPLLAQDPQNQSIQRMIADAHFNLGALALQEERTRDAVDHFTAALQMAPNDELARRSRELALRYDGQTKDLLYRIYVRYLPLRKAQ